MEESMDILKDDMSFWDEELYADADGAVNDTTENPVWSLCSESWDNKWHLEVLVLIWVKHSYDTIGKIRFDLSCWQPHFICSLYPMCKNVPSGNILYIPYLFESEPQDLKNPGL